MVNSSRYGSIQPIPHPSASVSPAAIPVIESREFRNSLGMFVTGVTVVTTSSPDGDPVGVTVSSFNSVSLDPPLILFSIAHDSASLVSLREASGYAVNVLAADQVEISNGFARAGSDKWAGVNYEDGLEGAPIIPGALAVFECVPYAIYEGGDHEIFVGRVVEHRSSPDADPLIFFAGGYRRLEPPTAGG